MASVLVSFDFLSHLAVLQDVAENANQIAARFQLYLNCVRVAVHNNRLAFVKLHLANVPFAIGFKLDLAARRHFGNRFHSNNLASFLGFHYAADKFNRNLRHYRVAVTA